MQVLGLYKISGLFGLFGQAVDKRMRNNVHLTEFIYDRCPAYMYC